VITPVPIADTQKVMSGVLFSIGSVFAKQSNKRDLANFTKKMVRMGRADESVAGHLYYYVEEGAAAGSGRLSRGMALCAKQWVQSVLRGRVELSNGQSVKINRLSRYAGPAIKLSRSEQYQEWINETPFFKVKDTVSYLTGAMSAAIIATPSSAGGYMIKVDGRRWAHSVIAYSHPLAFARKRTPIAAYAMWQEQGVPGLFPARPWISGAMVAWVQSFDEVWGKLLSEQINEVFWDTFDTDLASDSSKFVSLDAASKLASRKINMQIATPGVEVMLEAAADLINEEANALTGTSKGAISTAVAQYLSSSKIKGMAKKRIIAGLISRGLTRIEAVSVASKILAG